MRSVLARLGMRAGGGRASLANLGVLVTYIDMPSSPAVRVRRGVRIRAPTHIPAYGMAVREAALRPVDARARQYSVLPHRRVVTDILQVPASAFVYCVTVVHARVQRDTNHHFHIVSATRHAVCRVVRHAREERRTTCPTARQRVGGEAQ